MGTTRWIENNPGGNLLEDSAEKASMFSPALFSHPACGTGCKLKVGNGRRRSWRIAPSAACPLAASCIPRHGRHQRQRQKRNPRQQRLREQRRARRRGVRETTCIHGCGSPFVLKRGLRPKAGAPRSPHPRILHLASGSTLVVVACGDRWRGVHGNCLQGGAAGVE